MARTSLKKQVTERMKKKTKDIGKEDANPENFVSTGITLLNLALTDHPDCGWNKGKMANIIGDSGSGKSFLVLTTFAEATYNKELEEYRLIEDDAEEADEFDKTYLFGEDVEERIEAPLYKKGEAIHSDTVEDFQDNIIRALNKGEPFIYDLDSFDALTSEEEQDKAEEELAAREKEKEVKGSYGTSKPKAASKMFRMLCGRLKRTKSILLIISQTRDNISPLSFEKKTRSGGKALKFYATHELWLASGKSIEVKNRVIGVNAIIKVSKNKITGKRRTIEVPIFYDYGIDNIGSCIDFLIKEKFWKETGKGTGIKIDTGEDLDIEPCSRKTLIKFIEEENLEDELKKITASAWKEIEESLRLKRKKRYG